MVIASTFVHIRDNVIVLILCTFRYCLLQDYQSYARHRNGTYVIATVVLHADGCISVSLNLNNFYTNTLHLWSICTLHRLGYFVVGSFNYSVVLEVLNNMLLHFYSKKLKCITLPHSCCCQRQTFEMVAILHNTDEEQSRSLKVQVKR